MKKKFGNIKKKLYKWRKVGDVMDTEVGQKVGGGNWVGSRSWVLGGNLGSGALTEVQLAWLCEKVWIEKSSDARN